MYVRIFQRKFSGCFYAQFIAQRDMRDVLCLDTSDTEEAKSRVRAMLTTMHYDPEKVAIIEHSKPHTSLVASTNC